MLDSTKLLNPAEDKAFSSGKDKSKKSILYFALPVITLLVVATAGVAVVTKSQQNTNSGTSYVHPVDSASPTSTSLNRLPPKLVEKISPLTPRQIEHYYETLNSSSFPGDLFCKEGNLVCSMDGLPEINDNNKLKYEKGQAPEKVESCFYFRLNQLKSQNKVCLSDLKDEFPKNSFLPQKLASKISLSTNNTDVQKRILGMFPNTKALLDEGFSNCQPAKGEVRCCATSLEDMMEFVSSIMAANGVALMTDATIKSNVVQINQVNHIQGEKVIICHELLLPFASYMCHSSLSLETQIYQVSVSDYESNQNILAVCHFNTSMWSPDHPAFILLNISPGHGEICHWLPSSDVAWLA